MSSSPASVLDPKEYTVAWIAPLEIEAQAAMYMLDARHQGRFAVSRGDDYVYRAGEIRGHKVVIATLPAGQEYGTGSAAALASQLKKFFPNLWIGLLVGVAAGLPDLSRNPPRDIRLGDILVGLAEGDSAGLVAYDLGKETQQGFQPLRYGHVLATTEPIIRSAIGNIKMEAPNDALVLSSFYEAFWGKQHTTGNFDDPGQHRDVLYDDSIDAAQPIERIPRPPSKRTRIWYGPIGSGDKLLKNAQKRNELRDKYGVIGLEMEAAGAMNRIPVGVIRGVCDYGDCQKNKEWQPYAAAMAAAYAKAVLDQIPPLPGAFPSHEEGVRVEDVPVAPKDAEGAGLEPSQKAKSKVQHHIPLSRNPRFTGRSDILDDLEQKMFVRKECSTMAIVGLGGVGKTQVALQFAYRVQERYPEYSIFWVVLVSDSTVEQSYADIAGKLGLHKKGDDNVKKTVCEHLSSAMAGKWLLIVDNADDQELVFGSFEKVGIIDYLPKSDEGLVVMTTRSNEVAADFAQPDVITLLELPQEDSRILLCSLLIAEIDPQDGDLVEDLLHELEYLPLAIAQAAAYLNRTRIPIQRYLELLRRAEEDTINLLSREFRDTTRYHGSRNAVGTTWLVSLDRIQDSNECATNILFFLSFIEPKAIPQSILPDCKFLETEEALALLCGYSFLTRRGDTDMFDMHSLVHMATRSWRCKQQKGEVAMALAISHLAEIFPDDNWPSRHLWREYLPHAIRMLHGSGSQRIKSRYELFDKVGLCLSSDRRLVESARCHEQACQWDPGCMAEDFGILCIYKSNLAAVYNALGRTKLAIEILEPVVKAIREMRHQTAPDRLAVEQNLASAYRQDGRIEEATTLLECLVQTQKEIFDSEHPSRLKAEHELAMAYCEGGRNREAIKLCKAVVKIRRRTLDKESPQRLGSYRTLAYLYHRDGQVQQAIELYESVLDVKQKTLPKEDPERLSSEYELARAYFSHGHTSKAIELLEPVVKIRSRMLGEEDHNRLDSEEWLARAYLDGGQIQMATRVLESVLKVKNRIVEPNEGSLNRPVTEYYLARAYLAGGQIPMAMRLIESVLKVQRRIVEPGKEIHYPPMMEYYLARAYLDNGRARMAIKLFESSLRSDSLRSETRTMEEGVFSRMTTKCWLGKAYLVDGQVHKAIRLLEHLVSAAESCLAPEDPIRSASINLLREAQNQLDIGTTYLEKPLFRPR